MRPVIVVMVASVVEDVKVEHIHIWEDAANDERREKPPARYSGKAMSEHASTEIASREMCDEHQRVRETPNDPKLSDSGPGARL